VRLLAPTVVLLGCGSSSTNAPSAPTDAGIDAPSAITPPPGCDLTLSPKDSPACVDDSVGVFVDGLNGADSNSGTKTSPKKTIGAALSAAGAKPRVYICEGTYPEHVKLTTAVSLFGGFACASWTYTGGKPKIAPSDAGIAIEIANVQARLDLADLSVEAAAASTDGGSSIAAFVHGSNVRLQSVALSAGAGHDGAAGATESNYDLALTSSSTALRGHDGSGTTGGTQQDCLMLCTNNDRSTGGKGGDGSNSPSAGEAGKPTGAGGIAGAANGGCVSVGAGGIGGIGSPGGPGTDATSPTTVGVLDEQGWTPSAGAAGAAGPPGQGGGGGGGTTDPTLGAGGGGGCGGCGGAPGSVAQGGGASIALLSLDSTVSLSGSTLTTSGAGKGGVGAPGQVGQPGGNGGVQSSGGCQGGKGGTGGTGGSGAGGAGGVSAGIVWKGSSPTLDATNITTGDKGSAGTGGKPGQNDGPDGVKMDVFEAK
jgi:hypothetical protein